MQTPVDHLTCPFCMVLRFMPFLLSSEYDIYIYTYIYI